MPHTADGFSMSFTHRGSWKANLSRGDENFDDVPVTWTKGWRVDREAKETRLEVYFKDAGELKQRAADPSPFIVVLGTAHDYGEMPHRFKAFQGVFEVVPTGQILSDISLDTKVVRRL